MSEVDRFYGLIHNYIVPKYNEGNEKVPHKWEYVDEALAVLCNQFERQFPKGMDGVVNSLFDNELSFCAFADTLDKIYGHAFDLTYPRALGAIVFCGVYAKKLSQMECNDEISHSYQNSARYRNQLNQIILYMSKILDSRTINQWNGEIYSWQGFLNFITENATRVENLEFVQPRTSHPIILAATIGFFGILASLFFLKKISQPQK